MTDHSCFVTRAVRAGGRPLARAAVLSALTALAPAARAQPVTWEKMPSPLEVATDGDRALTLDFLRGEGPAATDPAADSLVVFHQGGAFLYNPSGATGAAGDNGSYGLWHRLGFINAGAGLVTAAGTVVMHAPALQPARGTRRGRDWTFNYGPYSHFVYLETERAAPVGALFAGIGNSGETARSLGDGAPGTWVQAGTGFGYPMAFGEVPPSAALPQGRILYGVRNGVVYSDDGGLSYRPSSAYGNAAYLVFSFAFAGDPAHSFAGVAYAGVHDFSAGEYRGAEVLRSDDGGATWTTAHRFTAAEMELPVPANSDVTDVEVLTTADGALWAAVSQNSGISNDRRGGVMRSVDGGLTWARADAGYRTAQGWGYGANALAVSRTGVLYAATQRGVWRTTAPVVVAGEAPPVEASGVAVSVRPNPAGGRVEVVVSLAMAQTVRVVVVDALGREVTVVLDGEAAGEAVCVDTGSWPAGVYVVRATAGAQVASARLVVAR